MLCSRVRSVADPVAAACACLFQTRGPRGALVLRRTSTTRSCAQCTSMEVRNIPLQSRPMRPPHAPELTALPASPHPTFLPGLNMTLPPRALMALASAV